MKILDEILKDKGLHPIEETVGDNSSTNANTTAIAGGVADSN
jgi:hypothetical protein